MSDRVLHWICMAFLMGSASALMWALEVLFKAVFQRPALNVGFAGEGAAVPGQELGFAPQPSITWIGRLNVRFLSNGWILEFLERDYYGLGQKQGMEPPAMIARMEKSAVFGGVVALVGSVILAIPINPGIILLGVVGGFFFPHLKAARAVEKRQRDVLMNLPSFVDLLALTIESGLDYLTSMERIVGGVVKKHGALEEEIENILREAQLGYPRRDALRHFARRVDVQEVRSLVGLLIQSDELGTGLVNLLRNFSQDMRNRRTGRAEEMAGKAATKMLGPMMIFIFPVIFALILAPFAYSLFKGGGMPF